MNVTVKEVTTVDEDLTAAFERLIPHLSSSNPAPTRDELSAIVESQASRLLVAQDNSTADSVICGSLTLVMFTIPTGLRAWIEDVVVDPDFRGKGVGAALNEMALKLATEAGATTVDLTSRPTREAANRLYQRLGFELRDTNVYRYKL